MPLFPMAVLVASVALAQPTTRPIPPATVAATRPVFRPAPRPLGEPLGKVPLRDLCRLSMENGQIEVTTTLQSTSAMARPVTIPELDGQSKVICHDYIYSLENLLTRPDGRHITTKVDVRTANVNIEQTVQEGQQIHTVALYQSRSDSRTGLKAGQVRLTVTSTVTGAATRPQQISWQAEDLGALRRQRPAEIDQYLRPVLRTLHAEHLLAPEPWAAHQVLADPQPAAQLHADVMELVAKLDADAYLDRQEAAARLQKMGGHAAAVLSRLDRGRLSHEQRLAVERILQSPQTLSAAMIQSLRNDPNFLLDCLYVPDRSVRAAALARLQQMRPDVKFDIDADPDARAAGVARLRAALASVTPPQAGDR